MNANPSMAISLDKAGERSRLPVLLIVHGDEYGWGSGNPYNGTVLASFAQIIVVTLNYRLGVYGSIPLYLSLISSLI